MDPLIQLIYCSAAQVRFERDQLVALLDVARRKNRRYGVTGMLLFTEGSFFQVLEGPPESVDAIFESISRDDRHDQVTVIIREAVARRSFEDWTMGFADLQPDEADSILGVNDFFGGGASYDRLGPGRAKKLLTAFCEGSWRDRLRDTDEPAPQVPVPETPSHVAAPGEAGDRWFSYAYQPIVDVAENTVFSHEALIRGRNNEPAGHVFKQVGPAELHAFDERSRVVAIELAASLGLPGRLNLNFLPMSLLTSPTAISSILETLDRCALNSKQIVLEVLEREIIEDYDRFLAAVDEHRASGLQFAIDDFGSGHAGLSLLAHFQPDFVKLDMDLIRDIDSSGPRQAIVRGILHTCRDLGVDTIAEGVETKAEYGWLQHQGVQYYQGYLLGRPAFEQLPTKVQLPR